MCLHKGGIAALCTCRGGKSSIQKVVFHKLSPNETLFLESTSKVVKDDISNSSFVQFQVFLVHLKVYIEWRSWHVSVADLGLSGTDRFF